MSQVSDLLMQCSDLEDGLLKAAGDCHTRPVLSGEALVDVLDQKFVNLLTRLGRGSPYCRSDPTRCGTHPNLDFVPLF
jgi:hypothetical protein